ncbi:MAG: methylated-DNA--[protein]-cysteine S-methyltransferase [Actinomycetota bacterium]|nr:methylated-DNA--[protein]-cysteine S-methyltransferase [Actinomycetota bacterium]
MKLEGCSIDTPLGVFSMVANQGAVIASGFAAVEVVAARIAGGSHELVARTELGSISRMVKAYFSGDVMALRDVCVEQPGGPFHRAVWEALRTIPPGETLTYGDLAGEAGNPGAARAAGAACGRNLIAVIVPCHRAVSKTALVALEGRLNNYFYGLEAKGWLLRHERARVTPSTYRAE